MKKFFPLCVMKEGQMLLGFFFFSVYDCFELIKEDSRIYLRYGQIVL